MKQLKLCPNLNLLPAKYTMAAAAGGASKDIDIEVTHGDAAEEILRIAHERKAGLIVIGPREHAVLARAPGAVLSKVIRKARCPVLAVTTHIC